MGTNHIDKFVKRKIFVIAIFIIFIFFSIHTDIYIYIYIYIYFVFHEFIDMIGAYVYILG